jgi:hypothetical protein
MGKELSLCHEQGMETVDGFELQVEILILLHSRF